MIKNKWTCMAFALLSSMTYAAEKPATRPNVLLIAIDDLND